MADSLSSKIEELQREWKGECLLNSSECADELTPLLEWAREMEREPPCGCDVEVNHLCDKHAMERARYLGLKTGLDDGVPLPKSVLDARRKLAKGERD